MTFGKWATAIAVASIGFAQAQTATLLPRTPKALTTPLSGAQDTYVALVPTNSGFLLGWARGSGSMIGVLAQSFSEKGIPVGNIAIVKQPAVGVTGRPKFAALSAQQFAMVWQVGNTIEGGVFNTATNAISNVGTIGPTSNPIHDIVRLSNGRVAMVTLQTDDSRPQRLREKVMLYTLDSNMTHLSGPTSMNGAGYLNPDSFVRSSSDHTVVAGDAGGYVVYRDRARSKLLMQAFSETGDPTGAPIVVNTSKLPAGTGIDVANFSVRAARLTNGNILVVWTRIETPRGGSQSYDVAARLFTSAGEPLGRDFRVNVDRVGNQYWPQAVPLADGTFAVVFLSEDESHIRHHYIRLYQADGTAYGRPRLILTPERDSSISVETAVAILSDGSLVHAYHDGPFQGEAVLGYGLSAARVTVPAPATTK